MDLCQKSVNKSSNNNYISSTPNAFKKNDEFDNKYFVSKVKLSNISCNNSNAQNKICFLSPSHHQKDKENENIFFLQQNTKTAKEIIDKAFEIKKGHNQKKVEAGKIRHLRKVFFNRIKIKATYSKKEASMISM